jgi:exopolysaccharide production protein ExoQ
MTAAIGLLLCIGFILFLLRLDRKQFPDASRALWIPTVWMLIVASRPVGYWIGGGIGGGETGVEAGSAPDRLVLIGLFLIGLVIVSKREFSLSEGMAKNGWIIVLLGYMLVSILWSDVPYISVKRWIREIVAVTMAFAVATEREPKRALECLFRRTIYILIPLSLLLVEVFPRYGVSYSWSSGNVWWYGVTTSKNGLARLCFFAMFFLIWEILSRRRQMLKTVVWYQAWVESLILVMALWLFMGPQHSLTYSATSTASFALGVCALWVFWRKKSVEKLPGGVTLIIILVAIIVYGTITPFVGRLSLIDVSSTLGREETLTGRSEIWSIAVPYAKRELLLGVGFGGYLRGGPLGMNPHNGYLQVILNIGLVGWFLFAGFLVSSCVKARAEMKRNIPWGVLWWCIILMTAVRNIAESTITGFDNQLPASLLFFYVCDSFTSCRENIVEKREMRRSSLRQGKVAVEVLSSKL